MYDGMLDPLKRQHFPSSDDGLLDEVVEIVPGSKWRKRDIAMGIVCSVTAIGSLFHDGSNPVPMLLFTQLRNLEDEMVISNQVPTAEREEEEKPHV